MQAVFAKYSHLWICFSNAFCLGVSAWFPMPGGGGSLFFLNDKMPVKLTGIFRVYVLFFYTINS